MGATKYEIYTDEIIQVADLLKSLAHPARLQAVLLTAESTDKDISTKELLAEIKLAQSTLSRHLKILVDSGFLMTKMVRDNKTNCLNYRVVNPAVDVIRQLIGHLMKKADLKSDDQFGKDCFFSRYKPIGNLSVYFNLSSG